MNNILQEVLNATIIDKILSLEYFENGCEIFRIEDSEGKIYKQAVTKVDDFSVVFSLPQNSNKNIFVIASDGSTDLLRNIFANIEEGESFGEVKIGNVMLLNSYQLAEKNFVGVIFLPIDTSLVFSKLEHNFQFNELTYKFILVTFITAEEHNIWKSSGHDALIGFFEENNKDLISF